MLSFKSTLSLVTALATVGGTWAFDVDATLAAAPAPLTVSPRFEPSPCPFTPAADQVEGRTVECGVVLVPENRPRPTGTWIRLAVAVFRSPVVAGRPPLVFLGGGPGTSILERFGPGVSGSFARDLTDGRDFVVFDQRGVGFSRPSLSCQELVDLKYRTIGSHQTREQETDDTVHAAFACRDRLLASGIELAAYTTAANAADVNDIRVALGYDQVDVWGLSYGTRLGLAVVQDFPEIVHSLVLESALPPSVNQVEDRAANTERAFRTLFDGCAADAKCSSAYPGLETLFYDLVADLNRTPASFLAQHPRTGAIYTVLLTGDRLIRTLSEALADAALIPFVPLAAASIRHGDFTLMSQATSLLTFDDGSSQGMFYSVNCGDMVSRTSAAQVFAAQRTVRAEIARVMNEDARLRICAGWGSTEPPPSAATPVVSDVPTLILAGEYDPRTPPAYAETAARTLRHSWWFTFPGIGHFITRLSPCAHRMMIDFLGDPALTPDASCIADMGPPAWFIPASTRTPF
jgi:pimeloyl-ACP methyl ester carboxylesterase